MEPTDKFPEERIGTVEMLRKRAEELEQVASACDAEASEREREVLAQVAALRLRSEGLREKALEYREGAHAIEKME